MDLGNPIVGATEKTLSHLPGTWFYLEHKVDELQQIIITSYERTHISVKPPIANASRIIIRRLRRLTQIFRKRELQNVQMLPDP